MNSAKLPSSMTWCLWFLLAACSDGGEPPPSTGTVVTDSAGVRMVANAGPLWNPGEEWRLTPEPLLSLGVVADTPLVQQFHRIEGLTRLTDGTIVVLNSGSGEVRAFDSSGRHLWSAGGLGQGPGEVSGDGWKTLQKLSGDTLLIRSGLSRITRGPDGTLVDHSRTEPEMDGNCNRLAISGSSDRYLECHNTRFSETPGPWTRETTIVRIGQAQDQVDTRCA